MMLEFIMLAQVSADRARRSIRVGTGKRSQGIGVGAVTSVSDIGRRSQSADYRQAPKGLSAGAVAATMMEFISLERTRAVRDRVRGIG